MTRTMTATQKTAMNARQAKVEILIETPWDDYCLFNDSYTLGAKTYTGGIAKAPNGVATSMPWPTGLANSSNFEFVIADADLSVASTVRWRYRNGPVTVKLIFVTGSEVAGDALTIYKGFVQKVSWESNGLKIHTYRVRELVYPPLGDALAESGNTDDILTNYIIPEKNEGKVIPLTFGHVPRAKGLLLSLQPYSASKPNSGQVIAFSTKKGGNLYASDSFTAGFKGAEAYAYDRGADEYLAIFPGNGSDVAEYTKANQLIKFVTGSTYSVDEGIMLLRRILAPTGMEPWANSPTDPENLIDRDISTFAAWASVSVVSGFSETRTCTYPLNNLGTISGRIWKAYWLGKASASAAIDTDERLRCIIEDLHWQDGLAIDILNSSSGTSFNNYDGSDDLVDRQMSWSGIHNLVEVIGSKERIQAGFDFGASDGQNTPPFNVYMALLVLDFFTYFEELDFYGDFEGVIDDGSGTYTGIASALIDRPGWILHYINAAINGQAVDGSSFDDVATSQGSGFVHGFQVLRTTQSDKVIQEILDWSNCWQIENSLGEIELVEAKHDRITTDALDNPITDSVVVMQDNEPALLRVDESDQRHLYTAFQLDYDWDEGRRRYMKRVFVNEGDNNLSSGGSTYEAICTAAQAAVASRGYNLVRLWAKESKHIHDTTTAETFLKLTVDKLARMHKVVELQTMVKGLQFGHGDQVIPDISLVLPHLVIDENLLFTGSVSTSGTLTGETGSDFDRATPDRIFVGDLVKVSGTAAGADDSWYKITGITSDSVLAISPSPASNHSGIDYQIIRPYDVHEWRLLPEQHAIQWKLIEA